MRYQKSIYSESLLIFKLSVILESSSLANLTKMSTALAQFQVDTMTILVSSLDRCMEKQAAVS